MNEIKINNDLAVHIKMGVIQHVKLNLVMQLSSLQNTMDIYVTGRI